VNNVTNNTITIVGHDLNACISTRNTVNDESVHNILGPFGLNNRNEKGEMALAFLQQMNLKVMTSFFEHKNYTTHISQFHNPPTPLTLDSISVSIKGSERVKDCKVWHKGVDSDHSAIKLTFSLTSIKYKASLKLSAGEIDWHKIRDDEECNRKYNSILRELCPETVQYTEFGKYMMEAGRLTATRPKYERKGWFEDDREHMQPLVEKKPDYYT
jgi:hypothetical protein